jgi:hypothetical protein
LLSDQQLRDASDKQLQDLIARVDLLLRSKGQPGLTLHPPEDERDTPEPAKPLAPGTIGTEQLPLPSETQRRPAKPRVRVTSLSLPRLGSRSVHPTEYLYV